MALGAIFFIVYSTYRKIERKEISFKFQSNFFLVSWWLQIGFEQRQYKFRLFLLMSMYAFKTSFLVGKRCDNIYFDNRSGKKSKFFPNVLEKKNLKLNLDSIWQKIVKIIV